MEIGVRDRGHDLRRKRVRLRGLSGARDEFHLAAAIVQNLKTLANPTITSDVSPTRLRRGATGTPVLLRRATAKRERPPWAIGIDAKPGSEFSAEEAPLVIP